MKTKTTDLHIRLTPIEKEKLLLLAERKGITISKLIVNFINKEVEK